MGPRGAVIGRNAVPETMIGLGWVRLYYIGVRHGGITKSVYRRCSCVYAVDVRGRNAQAKWKKIRYATSGLDDGILSAMPEIAMEGGTQ